MVKFMSELGFHFQGQYMTATLIGYKIVAVDHEGTAIEPNAPGIGEAIKKALLRKMAQK